jgi:cell division protein FtsB
MWKINDYLFHLDNELEDLKMFEERIKLSIKKEHELLQKIKQRKQDIFEEIHDIKYNRIYGTDN